MMELINCKSTCDEQQKLLVSKKNTSVNDNDKLLLVNGTDVNDNSAEMEVKTKPTATEIVNKVDVNKVEVKLECVTLDGSGTSSTGHLEQILADYDPVKDLEWNNGVASLPGSNLTFRLNEFGLIEIVADEEGSSKQQTNDVNKSSTVASAATVVGSLKIKEEKVEEEYEDEEEAEEDEVEEEESELNRQPIACAAEIENSDQIRCCYQCGHYGMAKDYLNNERFCSATCLNHFSKKNLTKSQKELLRMRKQQFINVKTTDKILTEIKPAPLVKVERRGRPLGSKGKKRFGFSWQTYLDKEKATVAPVKLFKDAFPSFKNGFRMGMKLEAVDPRHQSLICCVTVAEVAGFRVRLHLDGYPECYDFWVNGDSQDIMPAGWCEKYGHKLQPPKGFSPQTFSWSSYIKLSKSQPAPKHLFAHKSSNAITPHGFRIGMKLEAVDKKNSSLVCVATVNNVMDNRFLVHFDGWDDMYDYWADPTSPYIHPVGWCQDNGHSLTPPQEYGNNPNLFVWDQYLAKTKSQAAPSRAFKQRPANGFRRGMRLEAVDKRNLSFIRAAEVAEVKNHQIKLHFSGWSDIYDYWVDDDSPDIHPVGWCAKTGHPLQPPLTPAELSAAPTSGCLTPGCKGLGHIKGPKYTTHHSSFGCPYSPANLDKELIPDRMQGMINVDGCLVPPVTNEMDRSPAPHMDPTPTREYVRKCPTPGCDGSGHVTGRFTAHHRLSGCPRYERNRLKSSVSASMTSILTSPRPPSHKRKNHMSTEEHSPPMKYIRDSRDGSNDSGSSLSGSSTPQPLSGGQGKMKACAEETNDSSDIYVPPHLFAHNPASDLPIGWHRHAKLLPGLSHVRGRDVPAWSVDQVWEFVRSIPGCKDVAKVFRDEQIDGEAFLLLTQADIVKLMSIKLGPALKIFNSILMFHCSTNS